MVLLTAIATLRLRMNNNKRSRAASCRNSIEVTLTTLIGTAVTLVNSPVFVTAGEKPEVPVDNIAGSEKITDEIKMKTPLKISLLKKLPIANAIQNGRQNLVILVVKIANSVISTKFLLPTIFAPETQR